MQTLTLLPAPALIQLDYLVASVGPPVPGTPAPIGPATHVNASYRLHPMHVHGMFFKVLARNKFEAGVTASPAVADGAIFVRTKTHLVKIVK